MERAISSETLQDGTLRIPHLRLTVRLIMVVVAVVTLLLWVLFELGSLLGDPGSFYRPTDVRGRPIDRKWATRICQSVSPC